jgi:hypothetical protein
MDTLDALPAEQLASALKTRIGLSLRNGQCVWSAGPIFKSCYERALTPEMQNSCGIFFAECAYLNPHTVQLTERQQSQVLTIEEDLLTALYAIRSIRNTLAPINKLHPELLVLITSSFDDPFGRTTDCADMQFFCAMVCRRWRNILLAFPGIWSSVDTTNSRHMKLYLTRSKKTPLHVNYGSTTAPGIFEQYIIPERHRLRSFSIHLGDTPNYTVTESLSESAESLETLDMWNINEKFHISATTMETISRFASNITVLRLHDITTNLASLKFPALVKFKFRVTKPSIQNPNAADLIEFLGRSPNLEELDLRLPESFKADTPVGTVALGYLKSAVFDGSPTQEYTVDVNVLPYLVLPEQSITIDVQVRPRAFSSETQGLLSVIRLGDTVFPQQSITAVTLHIKDDPSGFFGHISICGERNNWIGLNHVRVLNIGKRPLSRLRDWLDPACMGRLHRIQTLTLGLFKFTSDEEQCVGVLRTFLRGVDQVRVLIIYRMEVSLVARMLEPSDKTVILPLLEELKLHPYDPPELTRSGAHDKGAWHVVLLKG